MCFPEHKLLATTEGKIFHDELGLNTIGKKFKYFPKDIWLHLLDRNGLELVKKKLSWAVVEMLKTNLAQR